MEGGVACAAVGRMYWGRRCRRICSVKATMWGGGGGTIIRDVDDVIIVWGDADGLNGSFVSCGCGEGM